MHKNVFGRQFKRDANERKALFKNLLTSLVLQERITTTQAKAKAIRSAADKLVTKAKKGGDVAYRSLHPQVNHDAVKKLIEEIAPRFTNRNGGYTRIIKLVNQRTDNAKMAILEWTEKSEKLRAKNEKPDEEDKGEAKAEKKVSKKSAKKTEKEEAKAEAAVKTKAKSEKERKAKK